MKRMLLSIVFVVFAVALLVAWQGKYAASFAESSLSGKVAETMDSGDYTYVLLEKDGEKTWAAVPHMDVTKGQTVTLSPGIEMIDFHSKKLNRTFKKIIFSDGPIASGQ
jgi:hypothetical protein